MNLFQAKLPSHSRTPAGTEGRSTGCSNQCKRTSLTRDECLEAIGATFDGAKTRVKERRRDFRGEDESEPSYSSDTIFRVHKDGAQAAR